MFRVSLNGISSAGQAGEAGIMGFRIGRTSSKGQDISSTKVASALIANLRTGSQVGGDSPRSSLDAEAEGPEDASDHFLIPTFHNDG